MQTLIVIQCKSLKLNCLINKKCQTINRTIHMWTVRLYDSNRKFKHALHSSSGRPEIARFIHGVTCNSTHKIHPNHHVYHHNRHQYMLHHRLCTEYVHKIYHQYHFVVWMFNIIVIVLCYLDLLYNCCISTRRYSPYDWYIV